MEKGSLLDSSCYSQVSAVLFQARRTGGSKAQRAGVGPTSGGWVGVGPMGAELSPSQSKVDFLSRSELPVMGGVPA